MKHLYIFAILIIISIKVVFSQSEFKIEVVDFYWQNKTSQRVDLVIYLSLKNIGTQEATDDDIYQIYLDASQNNYQYGKQIKFVELSSSITEMIKPDDEKSGSITFNVPIDADDLTLKFPVKLGGASKFIVGSYSKWINNNRYNANDYVFYGRTHFENKEYVLSFTNYLKALTINPDLKINFELGNLVMMFGLCDLAIDFYKKAISETKDKEMIYNNLGYAYFEKGYYDDAIEYFSKSYNYNNSQWDAVLGASISYFELNDFDSAEYYYKMAAKIENKLDRGMDGLQDLLKSGYFYTDKQINSINNLCKYIGYTYY